MREYIASCCVEYLKLFTYKMKLFQECLNENVNDSPEDPGKLFHISNKSKDWVYFAKYEDWSVGEIYGVT